MTSDPTTSSNSTNEERLETRKMIKDSVHGCIYLEPLCMAIIDTVQFQRLRHLKQLGASSYVYMGATHSRFEHSVGVAHLAESMLKSLRQHQPWLPISDNDILCVKIAGLCHDLGHGPFSHVYDGIFLQQLKERNKMVSSMKNWTHEKGSLDLLDHLIEANQLDLSAYGIHAQDYTFIRELILGHPLPESTSFQGRPNSPFLYEIVNNAKTGLDVDKLDYFMRDAMYTGAKAGCDTQLLLTTARVLPDSSTGVWTICWPEKLAEQLMKVFRTRFELHQAVYQHKVTRAIEYMICDALLEADSCFNVRGSLISQAPLYMPAYQHLDDRILAQIECSLDPRLVPAQAIIQRMAEKPLYKCLGKTELTRHSRAQSELEIKREIIAFAIASTTMTLDVADLIVEKNHIHYGQKDRDPLHYMRFFKKHATPHATCYQLRAQVYDMHCPKRFMESNVRVFVRDAAKWSMARTAFATWSVEKNQSHLDPQES